MTLKDFFDFLVQNKDVIAILLTIGGGVWGVWKFFIERWWKNRVRVDVKIFDVISNANALLPKLYATENDNSPLADHNIKYQPRDPQRDMQAELKAALNRSRYLLVTAPTGVGKTREAGMLAQTMIHEGWRVLRIQNTGWLDTPKALPEELNGSRSRVLIFLDDLNGLFSTGERTQSPRMEGDKALTISQLSFHDRLIQMLDFFEGVCTESEIRVIATARSEAEQWELLNFNPKDKLWKRFERIEIPAPADTAIVQVLEAASREINKGEFEAIAHKSDRTYRNILLNLRRWKAKNKPISKDDFVDTLDGSWRNVYERTVKKHSAVKYVYDAIDILRQVRIELFPFLVKPTATMIWGGNFFQKLLRQREIHQALRYLTEDTVILRTAGGKLSPSDGQIEAKQKNVSWIPYAEFLTNLLLDQTNDKSMSDSLWGLAVACDKQEKDKSLTLYNRYIELNPSDAGAYNNLGILLRNLKHYEEAEASYRKAIVLKSSLVQAYSNLGILLADLKRHTEAEASYQKAIEINPSYAYAYHNLGILLKDQKRHSEAEAAYRKAIELNPSYTDALYNLAVLLYEDLKKYDEAESLLRKFIEIDPLDDMGHMYLGNLLDDLKRFDEAENAYRKAIEINPSSHLNFYNFGVMLRNTKRYVDSEIAYRKSIELNPLYASAFRGLADVLRDMKRDDQAEDAYRKAIELDSSDDASFCNLGYLLYENSERYDESESAYRKAIELNPSNDIAYLDLGLLFHTKLKRYKEAEASYHKSISLNSLNPNTYNNLGLMLKELKRYDESESWFRKAVEIDPLYALAYNNIGTLLMEQERYEEATAEFIKAIEIVPSADNFYNLGMVLTTLESYDGAESAYRKAIELNPYDAIAYSNLGNVLRDLNRYDEAEASYRKAIEINPSYAAAYYNLAQLLRFNLKDRLEEALPLLEKSIAFDSEDFDSYLVNISVSKQLKKEVSRAYIEKARQLIPEDSFYNLACLESICDNFDLAFEYLQKVAQMEGFDSQHAWDDPDLQWLKDDPRFAGIIGTKPELNLDV